MNSDGVAVFKDALSEEGLNAEVTSYDSPTSMGLKLKIKVHTRDGPMYQNVSISDMELMQADDKKQLLASHASSIAQSIKGEFTETLEWGENVVQIDSSNQYSAKCRRCGTEVTIDDLRAATTPIMMSESSVPQPTGPSLHSLERHKKVMALLGYLRNECEPGCPNSKYDDDMSRPINRKF